MLPTPESTLLGSVAPGFEEVQDEFRRNFQQRGEIGAAIAVYHQGELVVDLWGGYRDPRLQLPWDEDTLVGVFSVTKGLAALTLALAHSRGWLDYDARVTDYWPEFGQQGKEAITVRQLLSHQAGLCIIDDPIDVATVADLDRLAAVLARQKPVWTPGTKHGYHPLSLGWYQGELLRRVDPAHRSLGQFFQDEIAAPLDIEFYIGLPEWVSDERLAVIQDFAPTELLLHLNDMPWQFVMAVLNPWSITSRAFRNPAFRRPADMFGPTWRSVEMPSSNGIGQVRGIAKLYGEVARGGDQLGITPDTFAELCQPAVPAFDQVARVQTAFSLGFLKPFADFPYGRTERAFGTPGMGGAMGFADPDAELGFAYAPNKTGFHFCNDPREVALRQAVYRCLDRLEADQPRESQEALCGV